MIFELLRTVTALLEEKKVPYMISGSLAFNIYCLPRMSMDIDFVVELNHANVNDFLEIFKSGYYLNEESVREEIKRKGMFNVIDHRSGLKMDFIIRKDTEYRRHEFSRKIRKLIEDIPVWVVSPEDLIISKLEWIQQLQSDKQSSDIRTTMADTSKEISTKQIEIYLSKSESERFRISDELNSFGRKVLESAILQEYPDISPIDLKIEVFKRCYKDFYSKDELSRIVSSMRNFLSLQVKE